MKRKATDVAELDPLGGLSSEELDDQRADVTIRHDTSEQKWEIQMSQCAKLLCAGCFELSVTEGTVLVRGSSLRSTDGTVPIASYGGNTCFKLTVPPKQFTEGMPLVLARIASAKFTLRSVTPFSSVGGREDDLGGAVEEPWDTHDSWAEAVKELSEGSSNPLRVMMCGPKKSGKSTLARHICNTLLEQHSKVFLLESDCGQPQFGTPGFVSLTAVSKPLLLPSHCQMAQPDHQIMIGDSSPQDNPITYINAIRKLHTIYSGLFSPGTGSGDPPPPLVINTMGWVKGFGLSLLRDVVLTTSPTHVVTLCTGNPRKDVAAFPGWLGDEQAEAAIHLLELPSICGSVQPTAISHATRSHTRDLTTAHPHHHRSPTTTTATNSGVGNQELLVPRPLPAPQAHSATEDRTSRIHAWMLAVLQARQPAAWDAGRVLNAAVSGRIAETAAELCACPPVVLDLADVAVVPLFEGWSRLQDAVVLNAALVGLVVGREVQGMAAEDLRAMMVNDPPECCGMALVHAVDPSQGGEGLAYLHTPASLEELEKVCALCVGALEIPSAVLGAYGLASPYLSLHCLASDAGAAGQMRSRRNLVRAGQM